MNLAEWNIRFLLEPASVVILRAVEEIGCRQSRWKGLEQESFRGQAQVKENQQTGIRRGEWPNKPE
jgi:hypothetical protein